MPGSASLVRAQSGQPAPITAQLPGGRYATALLSAASMSATVTSTTVSYALNCPDELTAVASAAAVTLSGRSAMTYTSLWPNAKYSASTLPSSAVMSCPNAVTRLAAPCVTKLLMPSAL